MFKKASPESHKKMLDGIELKAPVHGERTMLTMGAFGKSGIRQGTS